MLSYEFIHLAFPTNTNLVLLTFNCIHDIIPKKRNEEERLQTEQYTFIELEGTWEVIKLFWTIRPFSEKNRKTITRGTGLVGPPIGLWRRLQETLALHGAEFENKYYGKLLSFY